MTRVWMSLQALHGAVYYHHCWCHPLKFNCLYVLHMRWPSLRTTGTDVVIPQYWRGVNLNSALLVRVVLLNRQ